MDDDRLARVANALATDDGSDALTRLCALSLDLLSMDGAGIAVFDGNEHRGALAVSDERFARIDDLQFQLGEGPSIDASNSSRPVLEPDLARASTQWPAFVDAALAAGVRAHFSFPLEMGAARLGVLSLYRQAPSDLDERDLADALSLARIAVQLVLDQQAGITPGELPGRLPEILHHRMRVHQATGMIAAQLDSDVVTALGRLRAHAWANELSVETVAEAVVERRLRFTHD